jgi:hypothetical protein
MCKRSTCVLLAVCALVCLGASSASAAGGMEAWWHLTSGSRPTNLQPGLQTADEIQRVTVDATEGTYTLRLSGGGRVSLNVGEDPALIQETLENRKYGANNVQVTAHAGPNNRYEVYDIKFVGELADRFLEPVNPLEEQLVGGSGRVTVTQLVEGRSLARLVVTATNMGDANTNGEVKLIDTLPPGLKATSVIGNTPLSNFAGLVPCAVESPSRVSCTFLGSLAELGEEEGETGLPPYRAIEMSIGVEVSSGASSSEENRVSVSGGGAREDSIARKLKISSEPTAFGVENYELTSEEAGGTLDTQAGSHPFQTAFTVGLNQLADRGPVGQYKKPSVLPAALAKDLRFKLPPGLVGNPTAFPKCSIAQFLHGSNGRNACPADTAMGVATVSVAVGVPNGRAGLSLGHTEMTVPVFNVEPQVGEPARFGFYLPLAEFGVLIDTSLRSGGDYGITSTTANISQTASFLGAQVTLWGVPGDPRHDASRGWSCLEENSESISAETLASIGNPCVAQGASHPPAFLDLPTSCTGPLQTSVEADSWAEPGAFRSFESQPEPALDGCSHLQFVPQIKVSTDGQEASKPTGLTVDVHVPQEGQLNGAGLAQSNIKDIAVTLPEGVTLNPSAADGLQSCTESQIGYLPGESSPPSELHFTAKLPGSFGSTEPLQPGVNFCPDASKIATVKIKTPLLPNPLEGAVYLASPQNFASFPQENPFESHVAMYIVAEDPVSGSLVKLPGKVTLNEATGQIESTFEENPQLPFEDAELHFFGGERAPLASPSHCGTYTTEATFTPWSGGTAIHSSSSFQITSGPNGTPCPSGALPFAPSLASGTTNNNAGAFSALTTTLSRGDGQQSLRSVTLHYPAGLSGLLSAVKLCGEAEANAGTCDPASQIGETIVSVGLGGDPFTVTGGKVYITGPYDGAPFGLSIVNPAKAGPFDLQQGRPIVVRAKVEVDPHTAALTITTDPSGPHAIPTIVEGFPLQIQHVNVLVNRPGFTFNPTNCNPMQLTGAINSESASSPVSVPFQATNCAVLKFTPKFAVSTSGRTSKALGASLTAKLSEPAGAMGTQANITRVKVDLPKQLPSRLTTLQKACTNAQFEANPANCPTESKIGVASVTTPLLPVPLNGPVIFVSHGGEAFPSLEMVLQGYGVTVDLVGTTFISKSGITSTTFKTVPDVPFSTFTLTLPEGKFSALAANGDLCESKLAMPTEFVAQNGAVIHQSTPVSVAGCSNAISFVSTHVSKRTLTILASVPGAGKLTASGKGLGKASLRVTARGTVKLTVREQRGGKLNAKVKLRFAPNSGKPSSASRSVKFAK